MLIQHYFLALVKLKNSIFEIPIIPQTLNINLRIIRKLIKYSLKKVLKKTMFTLTVFEILLFEGRSVLEPAQRIPGNKRVKYLVKNQSYQCDIKF